MKVIQSIDLMRAYSSGKQVGFVPTMGFLHEGHASLIRRARKENPQVVVSIFVNPTQFGPKEDFNAYPRDLDRDIALLRRENVDAVFVPSTKSLYPRGVHSTVRAGAVSMPLDGRFRPGHFDGVCTVVKKLFDIVRPALAYFGRKDLQQTLVVKEMVSRLKLPVRVIVCPTVREKDGLAMSSRNAYLSKNQRILAPEIYGALLEAKKAILNGEPPADVENTAPRRLAVEGFSVQYFSVVDAETLTPISGLKKNSRVAIAVAAILGRTRLIDNLVFRL